MGGSEVAVNQDTPLRRPGQQSQCLSTPGISVDGMTEIQNRFWTYNWKDFKSLMYNEREESRLISNIFWLREMVEAEAIY